MNKEIKKGRGDQQQNPLIRYQNCYTINQETQAFLDRQFEKPTNKNSPNKHTNKNSFKNIGKRLKNNQIQKLKEISKHYPIFTDSHIAHTEGNESLGESQIAVESKKPSKNISGSSSLHFPSTPTPLEQQYRRKIQELQTQISLQSINNQQDEMILIEIQNRKQNKTIKDLSHEKKELLDKLKQLRADNKQFKQEVQKLKKNLEDEKNQNIQLQHDLLAQKDNCLNLQMQYQKDMFELEFLRKQKEVKEGKISESPQFVSNLQQQIKHLKETIEIKNKRYEFLQYELTLLKAEQQKRLSQQQYCGLFSLNNKSIEIIRSRVQQVKLNKSNDQWSENESQELKQKILTLQQVIYEENAEKIKLIDQIQILISKYEQKVKENRFLKKQLDKRCKKEEEKLLSFSLDQTYEKKQKDLEKKLRMKQDQFELELEKIKGFNRIQLNDLYKKLELDKEISIKQIQYWKNESEYWRDQCHCLKDNLFKKTTETSKIFEDLKKECDGKKNSINYCQSQEQGIKGRYEQEIGYLLDQLQGINRKYLDQSKKCHYIEQQNQELRLIFRQTSKFNERVNHLWMVKQVEYDNINKILDQVNSI